MASFRPPRTCQTAGSRPRSHGSGALVVAIERLYQAMDDADDRALSLWISIADALETMLDATDETRRPADGWLAKNR